MNLTEEEVAELVKRKVRIINNAIITLSFLEKDLSEIGKGNSEEDVAKITELENKLRETRRKILSI